MIGKPANLFCAFLTLAATLTCYKKLRKQRVASTWAMSSSGGEPASMVSR
jgi:hypothetical protein